MMRSGIGPAGGEAPGHGRAQPDLVWVVVSWARVVVGLGLAATAGVSFGYAWTDQNLSMWVVGIMSLLAGVLLALSAIYARKDAVVAGRGPKPPEHVGERVVPLLGALLIYKYGLLTHHQLAAALDQQKKTRRPIGEILVSMGFITEAQLQEALAYQQSLRGAGD